MEGETSLAYVEEDQPCPQMSSDREETTNLAINCPYNKNHKVTAIEFNSHVLKCRTEAMKYHPNSLKFIRCNYNFRHFLPEQELEFHELFCRSTSKFDKLQRDLSIDPITLDVPDLLVQQNDSDSEDVVDYRLRKRMNKQENMKHGEEVKEDFDSSDDESIVSTSSTITDDEQESEDVEFGRVLGRKEIFDALK